MRSTSTKRNAVHNLVGADQRLRDLQQRFLDTSDGIMQQGRISAGMFDRPSILERKMRQRVVNRSEQQFIAGPKVLVADLQAPAVNVQRSVAHQLAGDGNRMVSRCTSVGKFLTVSVRYNLTAIVQNEIVQRHLRLLSSSLGLLSNSPIPLPSYPSRAERDRPGAALNSLQHEVPSRTLPLGLPMTRRGSIDCFAVTDFLACVQAPVALPDHEARF